MKIRPIRIYSIAFELTHWSQTVVDGHKDDFARHKIVEDGLLGIVGTGSVLESASVHPNDDRIGIIGEL